MPLVWISTEHLNGEGLENYVTNNNFPEKGSTEIKTELQREPFLCVIRQISFGIP